MRRVGGRIVGNATVVNTGNAGVRSTTGLLGLRQGFGGKATGVRAFSVPALRPRSSTKVRLTTRLVGALRQVRDIPDPHLHCYLQPDQSIQAAQELLAWRQAHSCDKQAFCGIRAGAEHDDQDGGRQSRQAADRRHQLRFDDWC